MESICLPTGDQHEGQAPFPDHPTASISQSRSSLDTSPISRNSSKLRYSLSNSDLAGHKLLDLQNKQEAPANEEQLDLEVEFSAGIHDQLAVLRLYYWFECRALICLACRPKEQVTDTWIRSMMSKNDVLPHLRSRHNFTTDRQLRVLERCMERLPLLAETSANMKSPLNDQEPRPFLGNPVNGCACSMCDFMTDLESMNKSHAYTCHNATPSQYKIPPYEVRLQQVDGKFFRVKSKTVTFQGLQEVDAHTSTKEEHNNNLKSADIVGLLPSWLKYLPRCRAVVCIKCDEQPLLCKETFAQHLTSEHKDEATEDYVDKILGMDDLAPEVEDIQPWLGRQTIIPFLRPPEYGWCCPILHCTFVGNPERKVWDHEEAVHGVQRGDDTSQREAQVLVQYVSLSERVFFPVQKLDTTVPTQNSDKMESEEGSYLQELDQAFSRRAAPSIYSFDSSSGEVVSIISKETTTHRSLHPDVKFKDTYPHQERREILKNLWEVHREQDLKALSESEVKRKCREVALRSGDESIRAFRRFDIAIIQALFWTQHEIILLEEELSHTGYSSYSSDTLSQLTKHLKNYGKLSLLNI